MADVAELNPYVPFGDADIFYERCVFNNEDIPVEFKESFEGTVNFHKALKKFYGDTDKPIDTGLSIYDEAIYWNGRELVNKAGKSISKEFFKDRRFFLSGEDKYCIRYSAKLSRKNDFSHRGYIYVDSLPDRSEGYKLFVNRIDGMVNGKPERTCLVGLEDYFVKNQDILTFYIRKEHKEDGAEDSFEVDDNLNDGSLSFYNENNPFEVLCNNRGLFMTSGVSISGLEGMSEETLASLNLNLDKRYSKKELEATGVELFLTGINH